jgi:hypothetical protein
VRPGRDTDPSPPSSAEVKNRVEIYLYTPEGRLWPMKGRNLPTYHYILSPVGLIKCLLLSFMYLFRLCIFILICFVSKGLLPPSENSIAVNNNNNNNNNRNNNEA